MDKVIATCENLLCAVCGPKIFNERLDVFGLERGQSVYADGDLIFQPEERIGGDAEKFSELHQHLHRRKNIVILPIRDTLLADMQAFRKFHLAQMPQFSEFSDVFVEHLTFPLKIFCFFVKFYFTIVKNYLTNAKYFGILILYFWKKGMDIMMSGKIGKKWKAIFAACAWAIFALADTLTFSVTLETE